MKNILNPCTANYQTASNCVKNGGIIILPTDANTGLTIDPNNNNAIERVYQIKNRARTVPLGMFIYDPSEWEKYTSFRDKHIITRLIDAFWPGPINFIVPKSNQVNDLLLAGHQNVSIGCFQHTVWREFMAVHRDPIAMTSANISGTANGILCDMDMAIEQMGDKIDYVIHGSTDRSATSCTILDLSSSQPKILRKGAIEREEIEHVIGRAVI